MSLITLSRLPINNHQQQIPEKQEARVSFLMRASLNMAPLTGLEPVTYGLTVRRSTD